MERSAALVVFGVLALLAGCASARVRSSLKADLDGDGSAEQVVMVQTPSLVTVEVQPAAAGARPQRFEFGVDAGVHEAVCTLPVVIEAVDLVCDPMDEPLEGCRKKPGAKGLLLADGHCDPIQFYWNHDENELWWWRL